MLVDFRVKNYALIDELEMNFSNGLNVLTGETGAGKSIIIGALEVLLGARASTDLIRKGKECAYIEAVFEPEKLDIINHILEKSGIEPDPNIILLTREVKLKGSNLNRINGQLATAGMIKKISRYLVDIHGQHDHQLLLDENTHLNILDAFIGSEVNKLKDEVAQKYKQYSAVKKELAKVKIDDSEKARQIDLLEFQIDEIEKAQLFEDEIVELHKEYNVLTNLEEIYTKTGEIYNNLNGDDYVSSGLLDKLGIYMKEMEKIKDYDPKLDQFYKEITNIYYQLEELSYQFRNYNDSLEFDKDRLTIVENRLNLINNLQRKYGEKISDILNFQAEMQKQLTDLLSQDKLIKELEEKLLKLKDRYYCLAEELSKLRQKKANVLEEKITNELKDLAMKNTLFKIKFEEKAPQVDGIDQVEFLISPNLGEELKPLVKIASGGEISRIMLGLKTIISHIDQVDTLIFDEVDSGVGGKTAQMMAEKLSLISKNRQVICITHLPQIASMSDKHFFITKTTKADKTYTNIYPLDQKGKEKELARMLGGVELTKTTLKHAEEMLILAQNKKKML